MGVSSPGLRPGLREMPHVSYPGLAPGATAQSPLQGGGKYRRRSYFFPYFSSGLNTLTPSSDQAPSFMTHEKHER
jgi:hypothetical protein